MKHNKKRNTAFLYEALLREGTRGALESDIEKIKLVKNIILEHFAPETELYKELKLYHALEEKCIEEGMAEKFIKEVESRYEKLNKRAIFNEQTRLINKINKTIGVGLYSSFVPNYKDLATISQVFNNTTPVKEKILLEQIIVDKIKIVFEDKKPMQPVDNIIYNTFSKSFNEKYSSLLKEQKDLLNKFIGSFENNGLEFKIFLNEELDRLKNEIKNCLVKEEISSDKNMSMAATKTLDYLNTFKEIKDLSQDMLQKVLKIQQFVHEVNN